MAATPVSVGIALVGAAWISTARIAAGLVTAGALVNAGRVAAGAVIAVLRVRLPCGPGSFVITAVTGVTPGAIVPPTVVRLALRPPAAVAVVLAV